MSTDTSGTSTAPAVGARLILAEHLGTIRYVGPVDGTQGLWLGVEWDDLTRGKHDGVKGGRRYFTCQVPGAASFIRPTANGIYYGTSFLTALVSKYIEVPLGSSVEKVILGSSNGAIEVEAPGLDRVRGKLSNLQRLREVSLDNHGVAFPNPRGEVQRSCPEIRGLDLTKNLFPSWDAVAHIVSELPKLEVLALNQNRLALPLDTVLFQSAFSNIKELQINSTLTTWTELRLLIGYMPCLTRLETGYNKLSTLSAVPDTKAGNVPAGATLHEINLDGNLLHQWSAVCSALADFVSLRRLVLSGNRIETIDPRTKSAPDLNQLKHLSLMSNGLKDWKDVDRLASWCPALESLTLTGNPLVEDDELRKHARQFTIAKIPTLTVLDGAVITAKERVDCELFYVSYIGARGPGDEASQRDQHPRYKDLCSKYAIQEPTRVASKAAQDTLSSRLFGVTAHRCMAPPSGADISAASTQSLRVLPSMTMRTLRLKLAKTFKLSKAEQGGVRVWLRMPDRAYAELDLADDSHELDWWGLEDGSEIVVVAS